MVIATSFEQGAVMNAGAHAGIIRAAGTMILLLSPTLLVATALYSAGAIRAIRDRLTDWRDRDCDTLEPDNPPIEKLAADLRRRLLRDLAAAGLVLPPAVRLLAPDTRR